MKIIRDGKEFELTREELIEAYQEQEAIYDQMNIRDNMEGYLGYEEYHRLKNNADFVERAADMLRENQDRNDMGYDEALSKAFEEASKEFRLPVNRVTLIRERYSEHEIWSDDFWVDASQTPSKELFQKAVEAFLLTEDGQDAVDRTCDDFNWGDVIMYVPEELWNNFGIYSFDPTVTPADMGLAPTSSADSVTIQVDQDEVLIPSDYLERLAEQTGEKPSLKDQIQAASARVEVQHSDTPEKLQEPEK